MLSSLQGGLANGLPKDAYLLPARHRLEPLGIAPVHRPIQRSVWKGCSANFWCRGFSEVRVASVRYVGSPLDTTSRGYCTPLSAWTGWTGTWWLVYPLS